MKLLVLLLIVFIVVWALKRSQRPRPLRKAPTAQIPAPMIGCLHCGVHLPKEDAVAGQNGLYCSTEHRLAAKDHNPN